MASRMSCPWFVGRTEELRQLIVALEATIAGSSAAVLVGGDAGIGKSRLVAELGKRAEIGRRRRRSPGSASTSPRAQLPTPRSTRCSPSSAITPTPTPGRPEALRAALRRVAETKPVVLVIEDVHWADRSTRDLLTVLAGGPELPGVLLVATYRADGLERGDPVRGLLAELDRAERVEHLRLSPFGPGDVAEQLRGILGTQPPSRVGQRRARALRRQPVLRRGAGRRRPVQGKIPPGLHELLLARLDRLDKSAQLVVRAAAIGGRRIGHRLLAAAVELPTDVLDAGLRAARQNHLLLVDEQGYAFRHALVHEAVLGELLPGERAGLHAAFARAIDFDHGLVGAGVGGRPRPPLDGGGSQRPRRGPRPRRRRRRRAGLRLARGPALLRLVVGDA